MGVGLDIHVGADRDSPPEAVRHVGDVSFRVSRSMEARGTSTQIHFVSHGLGWASTEARGVA